MRHWLLVLLAACCLAASDPLEGLHWTLNEPARQGDFARAAALCHQQGDRLGEAYCLGRLGDRESLQRALELLPENAPVAGRVALERMLGELTGDRELLRRAAARVGPELETARCLKALGNLEADQGNLQQARQLYLQAQLLARDDRELSQRLLMNLGVLSLQEGDYAEAVRQLDQVSFPPLQGAVQINRATALSHLGRDPEAEQAFLQALPALPPGQASIAWQNLAGLYQRQKRWSEAEHALQQARQARPDDPGLRLLEGNLLVDQGRLLDGRDVLLLALEQFRAAGQEPGQAVALSSLAEASVYQGDFEAADRDFSRSEEILTRLNRRPELATLWAQRGEFWQQVGNLDQAFQAYLRAYQAYQQLEMSEEAARTRGNLARLLLLENEPGRALELLSQSPPGPSAGPARQSLFHQAVGMARVLQGQAQAGRAELEIALQLAQGLEQQRASVVHDLAALELANGEFEAARLHYQEAIVTYRKLGMTGAALHAERSLLQTLIKLGRRSEALQLAPSALAGMLELRSRVLYGAGADNLILLSQLDQALPRQVALLYLQENDPERALAALETSRGLTEGVFRRLLLSQLHHPDSPLLVRKLQKLAARLAEQDDPELEEQFRRLQLQLWRNEDRQDLLDSPTPDSIRRRLPPQSALLEYVRLGDGWHVFCLTREGLTQADLGEIPSVVELRRAILRRDRGLEALCAAMGQALLGPVQSSLAGRRRLLVVADDELQDLPFECLRTEKGYLVESCSLAYLNSARELWEPASLASGQGALLVGGADYGPGGSWAPLPGALLEATAIEKLLPLGTLLTDREATEEAVCRQAPGHRILHLATHGFAQAPPPPVTGASMQAAAQSYHQITRYLRHGVGIVLAGANLAAEGDHDGTLRPFEVLTLNLRGTDLVVLSACQTALGEKVNDEGVMGLRRAFRLAGVNWLLVSLWKVDDQATRALMTRFYRAYQAGQRPDEALRQAQLELLRGSPELVSEGLRADQFEQPYYWAAFIPVGAHFSAPSSAAP